MLFICNNLIYLFNVFDFVCVTFYFNFQDMKCLNEKILKYNYQYELFFLCHIILKSNIKYNNYTFIRFLIYSIH